MNECFGRILQQSFSWTKQPTFPQLTICTRHVTGCSAMGHLLIVINAGATARMQWWTIYWQCTNYNTTVSRLYPPLGSLDLWQTMNYSWYTVGLSVIRPFEGQTTVSPKKALIIARVHLQLQLFDVITWRRGVRDMNLKPPFAYLVVTAGEITD